MKQVCTILVIGIITFLIMLAPIASRIASGYLDPTWENTIITSATVYAVGVFLSGGTVLAFMWPDKKEEDKNKKSFDSRW